MIDVKELRKIAITGLRRRLISLVEGLAEKGELRAVVSHHHNPEVWYTFAQYTETIKTELINEFINRGYSVLTNNESLIIEWS